MTAKFMTASRYMGLAALLILLVLELVLRFAVGLGSPLLYVEDPLVGYQVKPNQHLRRFGRDIWINRYGMRSPNIPPRPRPGSYRLLVLGDSVTFGTNPLSQSDIFASRLHGRRIGDGCTLEVMNASASGWSIANELAYVRKHERLAPDAIVLVLNDHDLSQPFATLPDTIDYPQKKPVLAIEEAIRRYAIPRLFRKAPIDPGAAFMEVPPSLNRERLERNYHYIKEIGEGARRSGARFLLVLTPSARQLYEHNPVLVANTERFVTEFRGWDPIDLRTRFLAQGRNSIYIDKIHLQSAAHRLIGQAILHELSDGRPRCLSSDGVPPKLSSARGKS